VSKRSLYLIIGLLVVVIVLFLSPDYLKSVLDSGNPKITVEPGGWSGNPETDQVEEMETLQKFTKLQFSQDPSAAFKLYGIPALSETIAYLKVEASKDYITRLLADNEIDPGTSVAKLIGGDFANLTPDDEDLVTYYPIGPTSRINWWTPEEVRDATHTRTRFNARESFIEGIHGFNDAGDYTGYFHIIYGG